MIQTLEIFYSFECPYSYLAIERLSEIEGKFDIPVLWQPFSARACGKGFPAASPMGDRVSYVREDVARLAKESDSAIVMPDNWPEDQFDPERSIRGAIVAADLGLIFEYNIKVFQRWWAEGEDPNEQSFFVQLCDDLDMDPNEFSGRINANDTRERVRGIHRRGRKLQVFDTPTILIGEERFWGIDRIDAAEKRLVELGIHRK